MNKSDSRADDRPRAEDLPIVGIGASAGGIDALQEFLPAIPPNSGLTYVVVQHLDPDHNSFLPEILARVTDIPVVCLEDEEVVEADHIYVIPPNATLTVADGHFHITPPVEAHGHRTPVDHFLKSLADARGDHAACVILSGTGSDGTVGLRALKEKGGLTIAQAGAEYDGMMRSAVSTGQVDFVLPVKEIPGKLCDYFGHLLNQKHPSARSGPVDDLGQITALLRARTGHDFSGYKDKTIARRVQRRMQVLQIGDVQEFIAHLRKVPQELDALLQDLLIGVTSFFRDKDAFEALEKLVIPQIFERKGPEDTIRVWVPGCSSGEEAYSIAILLREHMPKGPSGPKLQIFASDIDEDALQIARTGRFPSSIANDIPPKRLERYFVREDGTYRISSDLREICLFSAHNLLRDAPFSKLDLISCRNLLIYLTPELQNRLIPLFHYALNDGGYLFLGTSENVTRHSRLFGPADKAHRIFQRRSQIERRLPEFPLTTPDGARRKLAPVVHSSGTQESLQSVAERHLLDRYAPAHVIVTADGELLYASARTGKYLELPQGAPRMDVFSMARQGLRTDLRAALHRAATGGQIVVQRNITVGLNGGRQAIDLVVHPLPSGASEDLTFMLVFQDIGQNQTEGEAPETPEDAASLSIRQLEVELRATRERLQTMTEELESSNEELKSGNEELSSMNEELQSANEELETSKEELQSINEELQTVNAELNARVEELSRANSDIANLLESTQIATVFLDRTLAVKSFTPAAKDLFRLVESDTGRPITHVRARFGADTVQEDAERVLRTLSTIERQIDSNWNSARYVMRMMPYRTVDDVIGGVVITFVDVTKITEAEARITQLTHDLRNRVQSLETILNLVPVGILIADDRSGEVQVNRYGAHLLGEGNEASSLQPAQARLRLFDSAGEVSRRDQPLQRAMDSGKVVQGIEGQLLRADGSRVDVVISATPLSDEQGKVRGGIASIFDISERKRAEEQQQVLLHELQHRVKNVIATISALASRMLKGSTSVEVFSESFLGRLKAMAATHDLLSRGNWNGTDLRSVIDAALSPHIEPGAPVRIDGPKVNVPSNAGSTLGMAFYELATNALKYGGISEGKGSLDISWRIGPDNVVTLVWQEDGGSFPDEATEEGFGISFVRRSIEFELNGKVELERKRSGIRYTFTLPFGGSQPQ